jgi:general secretion pathway protein D
MMSPLPEAVPRCLRSFVIVLILWWFAPIAAAAAAPRVGTAGGDGGSGIVARSVPQLVEQGRAQLLAGEEELAEETLLQVVQREPGHREADRLLRRIAEHRRQAAAPHRPRARSGLLEEVELGWQRPAVFADRATTASASGPGPGPLQEKLAAIHVPSVHFSGVDLQRVASTLSDVSAEYDPAEGGARGVNIVLIDPAQRNPTVSITLRQLSLKRILDFITDSVGYQYEVQADAVVIRPGGETSTLDTEFFAVTRSTVIRMTGGRAASPLPSPVEDPFGAPAVTLAPGGGSEAQALRAFLQQAGVNFDSPAGASLAYDGSAMIVTQTARNLERIRNILNRYNDVRQVEIEAKFMEVQDGALEELGVNWNVLHGRNGNPAYLAQGGTQSRSLYQGFTRTITGQTGRIVNPGRPTEVYTAGDGDIVVVPGQVAIDQPVINTAPSMPGGVDLAAEAGAFAMVRGMLGEFEVEATIRALSRQAGTDLLSAPKVTVLSGNLATITVAQELRYPQAYGEIRSEVGSARADSSSAGVTITAGTPQDFATRNVGVELRVTPTVEEDDYSISLDLNPKVTEFEGYVEYGGQSVAISGGTTVTIPSGFFQPIFSTREVSTRVTLWDGATLVMGGLTREEVKTVHDKVPVLGDLPLIGKAFRSRGQSSQKRNLLIFVTANLVSPGGSPKKQAGPGVRPSSLYQNPTIVTPGRAESRARAAP